MPDVANFGLIRPPFVYAGSIALGLVFHLLWPARLVPPSVSTPVGAMVAVLAIALFVSAVRTLRAAGTPVPGDRPPQRLSARGPTVSAGTPSISPSRYFNSVSLCGSIVSPC